MTMGATGEHVTIHDCVDAGITLSMSGRRTLELARELGYRIDNAAFYELWNTRLRERGYKVPGDDDAAA